jgi:SAM-dependent methyltransferase
MNSEQIQEKHYDRIAQEYEAHYNDACSQEYRIKFQYETVFSGVDLAGKRVLEAMCGGGHTTQYLLSRGAAVTGLDISPREIDSFRQQWPDCEAICVSALDSGLENDSFDCVVVSGGLHHVHPHLSQVVREIHRILKPGGYFCFIEPHAGSLPDVARKFWYKHDSLFADNEAAIDVEALKSEFASSFSFNFETYLGNVGHLLVLNSMVFRIPLSLKPLYTPLIIKMESVLNKVLGPSFSCNVVAQWQKKAENSNPGKI